MCLRWIPSNVAPSASIAPRERSFSASVFSSTRLQPQRLERVPQHQQLRLDVDAGAPGGGWSHVQPISTERARAGARGTASSRRPPRPDVRAAAPCRPPRPASASSSQASNASRSSGLRDREPAPGSRVAGRLPESRCVRFASGSSRTSLPLERRCPPAAAGHAITLWPCRSTSTRAWSARTISRSSSARASRS